MCKTKKTRKVNRVGEEDEEGSVDESYLGAVRDSHGNEGFTFTAGVL